MVEAHTSKYPYCFELPLPCTVGDAPDLPSPAPTPAPNPAPAPEAAPPSPGPDRGRLAGGSSTAAAADVPPPGGIPPTNGRTPGRPPFPPRSVP